MREDTTAEVVLHVESIPFRWGVDATEASRSNSKVREEFERLMPPGVSVVMRTMTREEASEIRARRRAGSAKQ